VAVDVAAPLVARPSLLARVAAVPAGVVLGAIVAVSVALRELAAFAHVTPYMVPDEYYYSALARSIATTGHPLIRGHAAHFPALLMPMLTAPFQLLDPQTAYRLTQSFDVVVMSLAALPAYALARKLGLAGWTSLACAAVTVASPGLFYAGFILSEPLAYPLALTAVYAAVRALDEPTRRNQLAFLVWAGLTTFTRVQYVVLFAAFAVAAVAVDRRRALRTWRLTAAVLGLAGVAALALGPAHLIGIYSGGTQRHTSISTVATWFGRDSLLLAYGAGWLLVPGAVVGLTCVRSRVERAFAVLVAVLAAGLLFQAAWIATIDSQRFEERYLGLLVPLFAIAFALWAQRGAPRRVPVLVLTTLLLAYSVHVPLSGYAVMHGKDGSPTLGAVVQLENHLGVGNGALVFALGALVLSLGGFALMLARRPAVGLVLALAAMLGVSAYAFDFDRSSAKTERIHVLPADFSWVDHAHVGKAAMLLLPGADRGRSLEQLFWNRSVTDVLRLGASKIDGYVQPEIGVSDDGRVLLPDGRTYTGPLLVATSGSRAAFTGAAKVAVGNQFELWQPLGSAGPRFAMLVGGYLPEGWLSSRSFVSVWPDASGRVEGTLRLILWLPRGAVGNILTLHAPGFTRTVRVLPGARRQVVSVRVSHRGPWTIHVAARNSMFLGLRRISVRTAPPLFRRATGAQVSCAAPRARLV
jgi:hypothetical membrane protein